VKGPPWKMLDEDAYIKSLRLVPASGSLGGGRPFRGPECGIFPSIFLSTWKLLLFPVPSLIRFRVIKGYSMPLRFFLWMCSWSDLTKHGLESWLAVLT